MDSLLSLEDLVGEKIELPKCEVWEVYDNPDFLNVCAYCKHHDRPLDPYYGDVWGHNCCHPDNWTEKIQQVRNETFEESIIQCSGFEHVKTGDGKYQKYLLSKAWKAKAAKRMRMDDHRCVRCGSAKNLAVHHITYDRLFCEPMDDLITVCNNCHKKIHENDLA